MNLKKNTLTSRVMFKRITADTRALVIREDVFVKFSKRGVVSVDVWTYPELAEPLSLAVDRGLRIPSDCSSGWLPLAHSSSTSHGAALPVAGQRFWSVLHVLKKCAKHSPVRRANSMRNERIAAVPSLYQASPELFLIIQLVNSGDIEELLPLRHLLTMAFKSSSKLPEVK